MVVIQLALKLLKDSCFSCPFFQACTVKYFLPPKVNLLPFCNINIQVYNAVIYWLY